MSKTDMSEMLPEQIVVARHALGLDHFHLVSYRNYFVTGPGSVDYETWLAMTKAGYAVKRDGAKLPFGGDDLFHLTFTGASKALRPGESLDLNDFRTLDGEPKLHAWTNGPEDVL